MIGQDPGKQGSWYEEGYVVLQLLRLLLEEIESVKWEARLEDGSGIDCWLGEGGRCVAVQCKTKSNRLWTLAALSRSRSSGGSVLAHARRRLEQEPFGAFRFVTDLPCPQLKRLIDQASVCEGTGVWWAERQSDDAEKLFGSWGLSPDEPADRGRARQLLQRMEVFVTSQGSIDESVRSLASVLSVANSEGLLHCLKELARRSLTRELRAQHVQAELAGAGITVEPRALEPRVHDRLSALARDLPGRVAAVRGLEPIERPETDRVLEAIYETAPATTVLVHGPFGCGKSEVLAAVVERLLADRTPVLALQPDFDNHEIGLGEDPIAALLLYSAGGPAVLVIDQLDQAQLAGDHTQRLIRRCRRWIRQAHSSGIRVVVGCRSVDAHRDTQLHHLLEGPGGESPLGIPVQDLDEPTVESVLGADGIAMGDLQPPVRGLARRAICLRLLLDIVKGGGSLNGLRSVVAVVDRWWATVSGSVPDCDAGRAGRALDHVIERMEADGLMSAPAGGLDDPSAIAALVTAGVLVREMRASGETLRPFHQVITDVRIVEDWRDVVDADDLLRRLGARPQQSLHQARRLRLAVPLLLDRLTGAAVLDAAVRSSDVRSLLKRGVLLGLAAIDSPRQDAVQMVTGWLDDRRLRDLVLVTVVRGQVAWTEALAETGWLNHAWRDGDQEDRDGLLDLLSAVSTRWGDGVAEHLGRWARDDPTVLERAARVFLHSASEDSDALFELRLEHIAREADRDHPIDWKTLLRDHPRRALALLEVLLPRTDIEQLCAGDPRWALLFPATDEIPVEAHALGVEAWTRLESWWCSIEVKDLLHIRTAWLNLGDSLLVRLVELLARCLAYALARDPSWWATLVNGLPDPQRDADGWLLLRVGASLPDDATEATDRLVGWFTSDLRWAQIDVGHHGGECELAREYVARVGRLVSGEVYGQLETWIAEYREIWTREDEDRRFDLARESGPLIPNRVGATACLLLQELPKARMTVRAGSRLEELNRKFGDRLCDGVQVSGGWVTSVIPDKVADGWSVQAWIDNLTKTDHAGRRRDPRSWRQINPESIGEYSLRQLVSQLRRLAEKSPSRYLVLAQAFDDSIPGEARDAVLGGIARTSPPDRYAEDQPWEGLDDAAVAEVVVRPAYRHESCCARQIAWTVTERPSHPWPDVVVERLEEMAHGATGASVRTDEDRDLASYRLNEDACVALEALAALAQQHADRRPRVLAIAASLVQHENPGRRASAAAAAAQCFTTDPKAVADVILTAAADPLVAAERDVSHPLFWLAHSSKAPEAARPAARARLLALAGDGRERVARTGGEVALAMRYHEIIDDEDLQRLLAVGVAVRHGIARAAAAYLEKPPVPPWLRDLALDLADDPHEDTGDAIIHAFGHRSAEHLVADRSLLDRLLATAAGRRGISHLLDACDRHDRLLPIAGRVLALAEASVSEEREAGDPWTRWHEASELAGLLARLVEEAEREGDFAVRTKALDAWDALLDSGVPSAATALDDCLKGDV